MFYILKRPTTAVSNKEVTHKRKIAVESVKLSPLHEAEMWAYLDRAATAMLNSFED